MKSDCVLATLLLIALGATAVSAQTTQRAASAATFVGTAMLSGADADQTYITDFCFEQSGCDMTFTKPQLSGTISPRGFRLTTCRRRQEIALSAALSLAFWR